jgi:hypothetical protein
MLPEVAPHAGSRSHAMEQWELSNMWEDGNEDPRGEARLFRRELQIPLSPMMVVAVWLAEATPRAFRLGMRAGAGAARSLSSRATGLLASTPLARRRRSLV